jgi:hypothetical protein
VPGTLAGWWFDALEPLEPRKNCYRFYHTTTQADKINGAAIRIGEGKKEFGTGFYTTCGDSLVPAKIIGTEWFTTKQKESRWKVICFEVSSDTLYVNLKSQPQREFLHYILTHSTGYPHGGGAANEEDLAMINEINTLGRS